MSSDHGDQPTSPAPGRTRAVVALSLVVAVVLGDSGVVTLALPEILRDFGAEVGEVAWVLIAFNLVLALVAVPAARVCVRGDPAVATAGGLIGFAAATTAVRAGAVAGRADRGARGPGGRRRAGDRRKPRAARRGHREPSARGRGGGPRPASPGRRSVR